MAMTAAEVLKEIIEELRDREHNLEMELSFVKDQIERISTWKTTVENEGTPACNEW